MDIKREYTHKRFGLIGSVRLTVPTEGWVLDDVPLTAAGVTHLATFALQSLQDAYAGAKDEGEALALWEKKLDRIMEGTIGTRTGVTRDPIKSHAIGMAVRFAPGVDAKAKRANAIRMVESNAKWLDRAREDLEWAAKESVAEVEIPAVETSI